MNAPTGTIITNPGTVAAIRSFMIFDSSILTATPGPGTLIEYRDARAGGVMSRTYTISNLFRLFNGDLISGASGGRRIHGAIYAPMTVAAIPNATMPYSGTTNSSGFPRNLRFDTTVFQVGTATGLTGPQIVDAGSSVLRSQISGSGNSITVSATTIAGATSELEQRLIRSGYTRAAVTPVIVTNLPATLALQDGQSQVLSVTLSTDVFPTPTYKWFRNNLEVATTPTFTVTGGAAATGAGTYRVEVSTSAGTATSATTTVTPLAYTFATNLPATSALVAQNAVVLSVVLNPVPITPPTFQWFKGATAVAASLGGTSPTLTVIGGEAATGAGAYRLDVTSSAGTLASAVCNVTVNATVGTTFAFTVNTPRTFAAPFATPTNIPGGTVNPTSNPAVASRQWFKAQTATPTTFVAIPAGSGGNGITFAVVGDITALNGPGVYRLVVTSTTGTTITSVDTVVTSGP